MAEDRMVPVSVAMSESLAHRVRVLAAMDGVSRSRYIRALLERNLSCQTGKAGSEIRDGDAGSDAIRD